MGLNHFRKSDSYLVISYLLVIYKFKKGLIY